MRRRCSRVPDSVEASRSIPAAVGFDVVYHTVGGKVLDASFEAVRRFGHVVSALGWGTHALAPLSFGATYSGVLPCCRAKAARITGDHDAGDTPRRGGQAGAAARSPTVYDDAYALIRDRAAKGKLVVDI